MAPVPVRGYLAGVGTGLLISYDANGNQTISRISGPPPQSGEINVRADLAGTGSFVSVFMDAAGNVTISRDAIPQGTPVPIYANAPGSSQLVLLSGAAGASINVSLIGLASVSPPYVPPVIPTAVYLPTVSAAPAVAYGIRAVVPGYAGALLGVQRASDNARMDVPQDANGIANHAAVAAWAAGSEVRIYKAVDQSGQARHALQAAWANMPLYDAASNVGVYGGSSIFRALMFDGDNGSDRITKTLTIPDTVTYGRAAFSLFMALDPRSAIYSNGFINLATIVGVGTAQSQPGIYASGNGNFSTGRRPRTQPQAIGLVSGVSNAKWFQDGQIVTTVAKTAAALQGAVWGDTGAGSGDFLSNQDNYHALVIYPAALPDSEAAAVKAALDSAFGFTVPTAAQVVQVGDSILQCGRVVSGQTASFQCQITSRAVATKLPAGTALYNMGVGGQTQASIASNASTREFALAADGAYTKRVLFIQAGTNDLGVTGLTGAQLYANMTTYIANARAAGFTKIVLCTLLPRYNNPNWAPGSAYQNELADYNARVRANTAGADVICDRNAHPVMGNFSNVTNTTYYQEGLHPTSYGYTLLPDTDAAAINQALSA